MAIIYTYPQINSSSDLAASDLMIISDMSANGRPTKSLTLKNLADFITTTGTGTGTTNAIIKWTDGPAGLLGDSIMNEDVDKIYVDGQLRIGSSSGTSSLQIFHGPLDSTTSFSSGGATGTQIIGRKNELYIVNRGASRGDIIFKANNGENNGSADTYFLLDASMADIGVSSRYTRWPDNSRIVLGNASNPNNLDFEMYHDGGTGLRNGESSLSISSKGGILIQNENAGEIEIHNDRNSDLNIRSEGDIKLKGSGGAEYFRVDSGVGESIFYKPVQVPLVPAANANAASKQYVDQQIASIPAGLVFQGNWDANANSPTLASGVGTVGNYYVVSTPGNTNLDGITDWEVGDWAVFVEVGGVDKWDKIDQTFVQGAGAVGQVSFWNGINSVTGDNDLYWDNSNKRLGIGTTSPGVKFDVFSSDGIRTTTNSGALAAGYFAQLRSDYGANALRLTSRAGDVFRATDFGQAVSILTGTTASGTSERLHITSAGNVGIGTSSPAEKLEVAGNIGINQYILHNNDLNTFFGFPGNDTVSVGTNGTERMRVNSSGNVGIGTTSPAAALDVVGRIGLNDGNNNVSVGDKAGDALTTGARNVAIGYNALTNEDTTGRNVAVGYHALATQNAGSDAFNVAVGYFAGAAITTGIYNVLLGGNAGASIDTGNDNIIIGLNAGDALTSGSENIAIGQSALSSEDAHGKNVAIGHAALIVQNAGADAYNVAIGYHAGNDVTTGDRNTLVGSFVGDSLTTGQYNVAIGYQALQAEDTGDRAVAIGYQALFNQDNDLSTYNVAIGFHAGNAVTTGVQNTIIGGQAGDALTTSSENTALGYTALGSATTSARNTAIGTAALGNGVMNTNSNTYNVAVGFHAGLNVSTGGFNTIIGGQAGDALTTGAENVAIGYQALSKEDDTGKCVAIGFKALQDQNAGSDTYNVAVGHSAGVNVTTGIQNTLIGGLTGDALTTGNSNVALGYAALGSEDTGSRNIAIGRLALFNQNYDGEAYNIAIGHNAGLSIITGIQNTIIGGLAGDALTTGSENVAIGYQALSAANSNESRNVAVGPYALQQLDNGSITNTYNTAVGYSAGLLMTTGVQNTLIGGLAGDSLTDANNNVAIGYLALTTETSGGNNVAIGVTALQQSNGGTYNVAIGRDSGQQVTTGDFNTLIGAESGDALTTGFENVAVGMGALSAEDTGSRNTAVGYGTLANQNYDGSAYNTAMGYNAGKEVTTGIQNSLIGGLAGDSLNTGSFNIALGFAALTSEDTGNKNIAIGRNALYNLNFNGDGYNVAVGHQAGENITTGDQNTIIGGLAGDALTTGTNNVIIGYNAAASASGVADEITLGNANNDTIRAAVTSITSLSDERDKKDIEELPYGLDFVDSLKPKKFTWNHRPQIKIEVDDEGNETEVEIYSSRKGSKDIGFIAQELDAIDDEYTNLVYKSNPEKLEATYGRLIPILVKAIQELSAEVKMLKNK